MILIVSSVWPYGLLAEKKIEYQITRCSEIKS